MRNFRWVLTLWVGVMAVGCIPHYEECESDLDCPPGEYCTGEYCVERWSSSSGGYSGWSYWNSSWNGGTSYHWGCGYSGASCGYTSSSSWTNDSHGLPVQITPNRTLVVGEDGRRDAFQVKVFGSGNSLVSCESHDQTEGVLSETGGMWIVTGVDDDMADGDQSFSITCVVEYNMRRVTYQLPVVNMDNEPAPSTSLPATTTTSHTPVTSSSSYQAPVSSSSSISSEACEFTVPAPQTLTTGEDGTMASVDVVLKGGATVRDCLVGDPSEGEVRISGGTITVQGLDDDEVDGDQSYVITCTAVCPSMAQTFLVNVVNRDNEVSSSSSGPSSLSSSGEPSSSSSITEPCFLHIDPWRTFITSEDGITDSFTVVPIGGTQWQCSSEDPDEASVSISGNTVIIQGVDDAEVDGEQFFFISCRMDCERGSIIRSVPGVNQDNEPPASASSSSGR